MKIFRAVDHQRGIDGLPGLRGAPAARQHANAIVTRQRERELSLLQRARRDHADRHDLVVRGIAGIASAREAIETHIASELCLEPPLECGHDSFGHVDRLSE
jgi:hypothetical protein